MRTNRNMACSTGITSIVLLTLRCERTGPYTYPRLWYEWNQGYEGSMVSMGETTDINVNFSLCARQKIYRFSW